MQLFTLWLMMLTTAAARVPVEEFLEGICHMLYLTMASQKQSIKKIPLFVCSYDIRYKIKISAFLSNLYASNLFFSQSIENMFITRLRSWRDCKPTRNKVSALLVPSIPTPVFSLRILTLPETGISLETLQAFHCLRVSAPSPCEKTRKTERRSSLPFFQET